MQTSQWFRNRRHRERVTEDKLAAGSSTQPTHPQRRTAPITSSDDQRSADLAASPEPFSTVSVLEQHDRAAVVWTDLYRQFASPVTTRRAVASSLPTDVNGRLLFTPIFGSHGNADASALARLRAGNDGEMNEGMLQGLRQLFEQHRQYFVALAPYFLAPGPPPPSAFNTTVAPAQLPAPEQTSATSANLHAERKPAAST